MSRPFGLVCATSLALIWGVADAASPGVVSLNFGGDTLVHVGSPLLPDEQVHLQYPDKSGVSRCCLVRGAGAFVIIEAHPATLDALAGKPVFGYKLLRPLQLKSKEPFLGAAIVGRNVTVRSAGNRALKVDAPGGRLVVRTCTSQEGFHVTGMAGNVVTSDIYFNLGYEVEWPTCPGR